MKYGRVQVTLQNLLLYSRKRWGKLKQAQASQQKHTTVFGEVMLISGYVLYHLYHSENIDFHIQAALLSEQLANQMCSMGVRENQSLLQESISDPDSWKLHVGNYSKHGKEYSDNSTKTYCSHFFFQSNRVNICWPTQV